MPKSYILIGFAEEVETAPSVFQEVVTEKRFSADIKRDTGGRSDAEKVNLDFTVGNTFSILANSETNNKLHAMRYVRWRGSRWTISDVSVEPPRLVLRLGGLYSGNTPGA